MHELTPIAIGVAATVALFVGLIGWLVNRKLAREQAAVTLIFDRERDYRDEFRALWLMIQKGENLADLAKHLPSGVSGRPWEQDRCSWALPVEQRKWLTVNVCLNYYEGIAIAVKRKAVDKKTVKYFLRPRLVQYVELLYPFIKGVRGSSAGSATTWSHLEKLAKKWGAKIPPDC